MTYLVSGSKFRRYAAKAASVTLSATTTLWLVGSSVMLTVPAAQAFSNEATVSDITSSTGTVRIAPDGESALPMLGINAVRVSGTDNIELNGLVVRLSTADASSGEATLANIEKIEVFGDSSLSGTNGVYDSNDNSIRSVTRNTAGTGLANTTLATQTAAAAVATKDATGANDAPTTVICVTNAIAGGIAVGDAISVAAGGTFAGRIVTVKTAVTNATGAGSSCVAAAGAVATDTRLTVDTAMSGRTATDGTITKLGNYPAGITAINVVSATNLATGDTVKIGGDAAGLASEIRVGGTLTATTVLPVPALTFAHANGELVQEMAAQVTVGTTNEGFAAFSAGNMDVQIGNINSTTDSAITFSPSQSDTGTDLGNDLFVLVTTKDGIANQTVKALIENATTVKGIHYRNATGPASIAVTSNTTNNESKVATYGSDGIAPTITKVESFETNNDGIVDRFKVYFSEAMASAELTSANFKDLATGGTASRINALDASSTDLTLGALTWSTTTNLNDTAQFDVTNTGAYTSAAQSTGDVWSVVYDADGVNDIRDATGTLLADQTISSIDKAKPFLVSAIVKDANGNSKIDQLEIVFSESLGASSNATGFAFTDIAVSPTYTYALGSVLGFATSTPTGFNSNDTLKLAVTERSGADITGATWRLAYTAGTPGVIDAASNEAQSRSAVVPTLSTVPVLLTATTLDNNNNGRIDRAVLTFNVIVTESGTPASDFTVSGYVVASGAGSGTTVYTLTLTEGTPVDTDVKPDVTYVENGGTNYLYAATDALANRLQSLTSASIAEGDKALPVLTLSGGVANSAVLYENTANDIWEAAESLQLVMSEAIDPATVSTSWSGAAGTGTVFTDFRLTTTGDADLADGQVPDSGTVAVNGNIITLTASVSATAALLATDKAFFVPNEVKDLSGNSTYPSTSANGVALVVTPTTAPTVSQVTTWDSDADGLVDRLVVSFNGLVKASTLVVGDWKVAYGSNFTIADAVGEAATSTAPVTPDAAITSVVTGNGVNDSKVYINFTETSGGSSGEHPQVKYVQGSLADTAGTNKVATFNAYASDTTKFETGIANDALDKAPAKVLGKILKDRNLNGKIDQLVVVFSEGIDNDVTLSNALAAGNLASTGWAVANHTLAQTGALSSNTSYQNLTFVTTNAVYSVDVNEAAAADTALPAVTYVSSGVFKDKQGNVLADAAAGGETSSMTFAPAPPPPGVIADGSLVRGSDPKVYVTKLVGSKKFQRHVLSASFDMYYPHLAPFWSMVTSGANLTGYTTSAWIRLPITTDPATWKIWEVNGDGSKHWITCADANNCGAKWLAAGGDADGVYTVNQAEFNSYTAGPNVFLP